MKKIKVISKAATGMDETGQMVESVVLEPETPIPATALRVECDGEFYTVYEQGDV